MSQESESRISFSSDQLLPAVLADHSVQLPQFLSPFLAKFQRVPSLKIFNSRLQKCQGPTIKLISKKGWSLSQLFRAVVGCHKQVTLPQYIYLSLTLYWACYSVQLFEGQIQENLFQELFYYHLGWFIRDCCLQGKIGAGLLTLFLFKRFFKSCKKLFPEGNRIVEIGMQSTGSQPIASTLKKIIIESDDKLCLRDLAHRISGYLAVQLNDQRAERKEMKAVKMLTPRVLQSTLKKRRGKVVSESRERRLKENRERRREGRGSRLNK